MKENMVSLLFSTLPVASLIVLRIPSSIFLIRLSSNFYYLVRYIMILLIISTLHSHSLNPTHVIQ